MKSPEKPRDEPERLSELRALKILDTPPEERFDRYTRMARRLFDVPIAVVSLVDADRQWFKSIDGLDVCETSRDVSFCGHAILDPRLFVVEDALEDDRFCDNPLVVGPPHIRFYAGAPVPVRSKGSALGTLCLLGHEPRSLSPGERTLLRDLADMVGESMISLDMASMDELTGISNRRGLMALARKSFAHAVKQEEPLSLVYIDVNRFKQINDTYGHEVGDIALKEVAKAVRNSFRTADITGRLGGDEFCAILPTATAEQAGRVVTRLRKGLEDVAVTSDLVGIDISCGVVELDPSVHDSVDAMLRDADQLMYRDKSS